MNAKLNAAQLFASSLQASTRAAQAGLVKFRKEFGSSPIKALAWADAVYHHATLVPIAKHVLLQLANGETLDAISARLQEQVNELATQPYDYTSHSASLLQRATLTAAAQILREAREYAALAAKAEPDSNV